MRLSCQPVMAAMSWLKNALRPLSSSRRLPPWRLNGAKHLWRDTDAALIFWWDTATSTLLGVGHRPPGAVSLSMGPPEVGDAVEVDVPAAVGDPASASELHQRLNVGTTSRPGLLVAAPARLALDLQRLDARRMHLAVAVAERVYRRDDAGRVLHKPWNQLPVEFSVEVAWGSDRRRLWSRQIAAKDGFVVDSVDLSELPSGPLTVELHTSAGLPTEGFWPFGFWADLALSGQAGSAGSAGVARPHVVIIDVDTLRADRLGCYGHTRDTTPRLDDWVAAHATVYKDVMAASNWTLPSTASMLTGLSVRQHGLLRGGLMLGAATPTLATRLRRAGYQTLGVVEGGFVKAAFGFDQGFDVFDQVPKQEPHWNETLEWLEKRRDERPVFLFLHTYFVHGPWAYDPHFDDPLNPYAGPLASTDVTHERVIEPFEAGRLPLDEADRAYVNALYDAAVARLDDYLCDFIERLDRILPPERRLLVITSDHGEELFERGHIQHGNTLYDELLSVPFIVQYPGRTFGSMDTSPVSGLDLVPTVLDAVGLEVPLELPGRSLLRAYPDARVRVAQHADTAHALRFDGWKLIMGDVEGERGTGTDETRMQLYDLNTDPVERRDIAAAFPELVRRLVDMLDDFQSAYGAVAPTPVEEEIDPDVLQDLRALGYIEPAR